MPPKRALRTGGVLTVVAVGTVALAQGATAPKSPLTILSPRDGSTVSRVVPLNFTSSLPGAMRAVLFVDGQRRVTIGGAQVRAASGRRGWDTRTLRNGRHRITLRVYLRDQVPLVAKAVVKVSNPVLTILAPDAGSVKGVVPWRVKAPRTTKRLDFMVDGKVIKSADNPPWRLSTKAMAGWNSRSVSNGTHVLSVAAHGRRGVVRTARVKVTVANPGGGAGGGATKPGGATAAGGKPPAASAPAASAPAPAAPATPAMPSLPPGTGFFSPTSVWNAAVPASAPLDPSSNALVGDLLRQVSGYGPWINTSQYSTAIYTVPADMRKVKIKLLNSYQDPKVLAALAAVPMPPDARPSDGTDHHLALWQPSTDTMWEFFALEGSGDNWTAYNAAKIVNVSQSSGVNELTTGATASGLALVGGVVTLNDWKSGHIDHALALAIPEPRREWLTRPANRTDGWLDSATAIPEGAHFRLDPSLNIASLNLPPATRMLAEAAQKYGIVVRDKSGSVSFYGEDPTPTGTDPYPAIFGAAGPGAVASAFPWDKLQLLKMDLKCCWQVP